MRSVIYSTSAEETRRAGTAFAEQMLLPAVKSGKKTAAVLLSGDLGAGKTGFVKGVASALGITEPIASPTFAIVNEYSGQANDTAVNFFHFDLYRLNGAEDLEGIGFYDYLLYGGVFAIEWQERAAGIETEFDDTYRVNIVKTGDETREICIEHIGD
jgi:tRNA threonylcarbamoyladenosine biosynthesis protein TsaE